MFGRLLFFFCFSKKGGCNYHPPHSESPGRRELIQNLSKKGSISPLTSFDEMEEEVRQPAKILKEVDVAQR
jgi:hypothetical protein